MQVEINKEHVVNNAPAAATAVDSSKQTSCSCSTNIDTTNDTTTTTPRSVSGHDDPIVATATTQSNVIVYPKNTAAAVDFIVKEEDIVIKVEPKLITGDQEQVDDVNDVKFSTTSSNNLDDASQFIEEQLRHDGKLFEILWTYPCQYCTFKSLTKFGLECHSSVIHGRSTFCCPFLDCFISFLSPPELTEHMKKHRQSSFYCVFCQQKVSNAISLKIHQRFAHDV